MPEPNQEIMAFGDQHRFFELKAKSKIYHSKPCGDGEASGERAGPSGIGPIKKK